MAFLLVRKLKAEKILRKLLLGAKQLIQRTIKLELITD
jgi:hypothetical protein